MQKYIIGLITGIFFTASFFILVAAKSMADHTHDADEINYSEHSYGGWGTLQKKIPAPRSAGIYDRICGSHPQISRSADVDQKSSHNLAAALLLLLLLATATLLGSGV